ncbi:hypothetical protein OG216_35220 [Streptomycetaceae bacterium NBC_01309]
MIQINIKRRHEANVDDALGRKYAGWSEDLTPQEVYDAARGCWSLGPNADTEKFAAVVHAGTVRCVIEIDRIEDTSDGKRALVGRPVGAGHRFYDR